MDVYYHMTEQVIIPFFIILFVFTAFGAVELLRGNFLRTSVAIFLVFALLILFTDLRSEGKYLRENYSFNGVIHPEIEVVEITMPVIFVEICNTGVITGGYDEVRNL